MPITPEPPHCLGPWLFLRVLGISYACAFASLFPQALALLGSHGIHPIAILHEALLAHRGAGAYLVAPSVFWLIHSDLAIELFCAIGFGAALTLTLNVAPRLSAFLCWALYLSFLNSDFLFLQYQWDQLLVEAGFLGILLVPRGGERSPAEIALLCRWLLFRLMFSSGVVKLASGDPTWHSLTALDYHYLTQPLPTPIAYYVSRLPESVHQACVAIMFAIELIAPFFFFARGRLRTAAALVTIFLQVIILLTGNYAFFNLLTIGLCAVVLPDSTLRPLVSATTVERLSACATATGSRLRDAIFGIVVLVGTIEVSAAIVGFQNVPRSLRSVVLYTNPLRLVNTYGLFAVMTTERREIVLEGSADGESWRSYELPWKPGDPSRLPPLVAPHQPRLDWQLWFAALGSPQQNPWLLLFLRRIAEAEPSVLALLEDNPFPEAPPRYLRALLYEYHFTTLEERKLTGNYWRRKLLGYYLPSIDFKNLPARP